MVGKLSAEGLHGQFDFITMVADSSISYDGHSQPYGTNDAGKAVVLTGDMQVGLATSGNPYGVLISVEADKTCRVGKGGVQEFAIGGTPPTFNSPVVATTGSVVINGATGVGRVVDVDTVRAIAWVDLG